MKKFFLNQLVIYPLLFGVIGYFAYRNFPDFYLVEMAKDVYLPYLKEIFTFINFTDVQFFTVYGLLIGYVYGSLSVVVKVRNLKSIILMGIVLYVKLTLAMILGVSFGLILYPVQLILTPIIIYLAKLYSKKQQRKRDQIQQDTNDNVKVLMNKFEEFIQSKKAQS
jgi:hypothetical protein